MKQCNINFTIAQNTNLPPLDMTLTQTVSGAQVPINLTGATINFCMKSLYSTDVERSLSIVTNAAQGQVRKTFSLAETTEKRRFEFWVEVAWGGQVERIPLDTVLVGEIV